MPKFAYRPPPGDAASTEMCGVTFDANVAVEITDKHFLEMDHPERFEMPDGSIRSRTVHKRIPLAELLRHNPHFVEIVEEKQPPKGAHKAA